MELIMIMIMELIIELKMKLIMILFFGGKEKEMKRKGSAHALLDRAPLFRAPRRAQRRSACLRQKERF